MVVDGVSAELAHNGAKLPYKKKLIEVALPLQAINAASAREKNIFYGHPSTIHQWWARRPLAACRAVLFASLVDDPSTETERFPTVESQEKERKRLFSLIEELVQWENSLSEDVLSRARAEIRRCVGEQMPTIHDPFCGGGSIPLEAQRLGLPTLASDLNPIAVLITKALTEIPYRFKGLAPLHPTLNGPLQSPTWARATGLAADVEAYGLWILDRARELIGAFYPPIKLEHGRDATVIAWLWARTVRCNNPVCGAEMPLVKSFALSTKVGKEWAVEPIIDRTRKTVRFETRSGKPSRPGTIDRRGAKCLICDEVVKLDYIRHEGRGKRIGERMLAIVAEGDRGRLYLAPDADHERIARSAEPTWAPDTDLVYNSRHMSPPLYGMTKHRDLFCSRQILTLSNLCTLVKAARSRMLSDAAAASARASAGGTVSALPVESYADAVTLYLALGIGKLADYNSTLCRWDPGRDSITHTFARQNVNMIWDYAEANPLAASSGSFIGILKRARVTIGNLLPVAPSEVRECDAVDSSTVRNAITSTDPPYYDYVPYSDLSDFFYTWIKFAAQDCYPDLFATLLTPKAHELVADPVRFGGDSKASRRFFEQGMAEAFKQIARRSVHDFPTIIYYAFKQDEDSDDSAASGEAQGPSDSAGWEAMLSAVLGAGFSVVGTWPIRTERSSRTRGQRSNALASSIVLVCRLRAGDAAICSRADYVHELRAALPPELLRLRQSNLAATDLQQAAIGPGMSIFSKYALVLEGDDQQMSVRSALAVINEELAQALLGDIADVDAASQFAIAWFAEHAYEQEIYGRAEVLLKAKNARIGQLVQSGVAFAEAGYVRLRSPQEVVPAKEELSSYPVWAQLIHLMGALSGIDGGESRAATLLRQVDVDQVRDIAYHCYIVADLAKRQAEARDFNELIAAWPTLLKLAAETEDGRLL